MYVSKIEAAKVPLVVDLDGTLIRSDTLVESILKIARDRPRTLLFLPKWVLRGRAYLKSRVAEICIPDVSLLPYRPSVLRSMREAKAEGRRVVLATAANIRVGQAISDHLGNIDEVFASTSTTNLKHHRKANLLIERFGVSGYDYIGNCSDDVPSWKSARRSLNVGSELEVPTIFLDSFEVEQEQRWFSLFQAMRPHQWVKNLLLFAPLIASQTGGYAAMLNVVAATVCFCAIASAIYVINDLLDVEADRQHSTKSTRPFASGKARGVDGVAAAVILLLLGFGGSCLISLPVTLSAAAYIALALGYSWKIKKVPLADVMALASLYTIRVVAGAAALAIWPSFWLLGFSIFLFTSLAFAKRFVELNRSTASAASTIIGRGYRPDDAQLLGTFGISSGYGAVVMLSLYVNHIAGESLYGTPALLWVVCPMLFYWVSHIWMAAHRCTLHDDPVVFALRDRTSYFLGIAAAMFIAAADRLILT